MLKSFRLFAVISLALVSFTTSANEGAENKKLAWRFEGITGYVDKAAAQRGFQIYSQICSNCHAMSRVAYRNLSELGFTEAEIKSVAASKQVEDYDDNGQRIMRPAKPFDTFVPPFANEAASRAANGGAYPPDLSLIVKARHDGANYVYSLITGFGKTVPTEEKSVEGKYYNPYFSTHWISMPPPLADGVVTYQDGTVASLDQAAKDVVVFLQWAAEPEMEQRKQLGLKVLIFLSVLTIMLYLAKRRIWSNVKH